MADDKNNSSTGDKPSTPPTAKTPSSMQHSPTDAKFSPSPDLIAARLGMINPDVVRKQ